MLKLFAKKSLSGISVPHRKYTKDMQTEIMPVPAKVYISMQQHMGAPCNPVVKVGDLVKVGQLIGNSENFMSAPIHSSVSGKVVAIDSITQPSGKVAETIVIESDGLQELSDSIAPPVISNKEDFVTAVRNSGLVGLGGAGFPTSVKLNVKPSTKIDVLIINAAECEPYITTDNREMLENPNDVLDGIKAVVKYLSIPNVIIGIETNKPEAINVFNDLFANLQGYKVAPLKTTYPQGAEKVLIYETTGKVVEEGKLPSDVGALVMNVSSVGFLGRYLKNGIPLISKRITVDGGAIKNNKNVEVLIGTPISDIANFCGGFKDEVGKILMGGPMTGICVYNIEAPLLKNNNAILFFNKKESILPKTTACIRCGKCAEVCPVNLMPAQIERSFAMKDVDTLKKLKVNLCIECGCCGFICPAKRDLVLTNQLGKKLLRESKPKI